MQDERRQLEASALSTTGAVWMKDLNYKTSHRETHVHMLKGNDGQRTIPKFFEGAPHREGSAACALASAACEGQTRETYPVTLLDDLMIWMGKVESE